MKAIRLIAALCMGGFLQSAFAGPEIYDPLAAYKKANNLPVRPARETVTVGNNRETARFTYDNGLLVRADYSYGPKDLPAGHCLYEYEKGVLVHEQLFDAVGRIAEEIRYHYKSGRLDKSLIHDVRGSAKIEWHYLYDKEGNLVGGKRLLGGKPTESFKLVKHTGGITQHIYNAKGELTAQVESVLEKGMLKSRVRTGLTGARYAEYRYDEKNLLIEIIYHETVRGEKTLVKKHHFDYSLQRDVPKTALNTHQPGF